MLKANLIQCFFHLVAVEKQLDPVPALRLVAASVRVALTGGQQFSVSSLIIKIATKNIWQSRANELLQTPHLRGCLRAESADIHGNHAETETSAAVREKPRHTEKRGNGARPRIGEAPGKWCECATAPLQCGALNAGPTTTR